MAMAHMPSSRPGKPIRSFVVAFTPTSYLTHLDSQRVGEMLFHLGNEGQDLGRSAIRVASML